MTSCRITSLAAALCCLFGSGLAQPTITDSNVGFVIGEFVLINGCDYVPPGPSGPNQTWDLTALTATSELDWSYIDPASTPNPAPFTGATAAEDRSGQYYYYFTDAMVQQYLGYDGPGAMTTTCTDRRDDLRFPFSFNDSYTDTYRCTTVVPAVGWTSRASAELNVTADSYGTLLLPNGIFWNVLRIYTVENRTDSTFDVSGALIYAANMTHYHYRYYQPGTHYWLAKINKFLSGENWDSTAEYNGSLLSMEQNPQQYDAQVRIFPSPAADEFQLTALIPGIPENDFEILLENSYGSLVEKRNIHVATGQQLNEVFQVSNLRPGIYFATIGNGGFRVVKKFVKL
jgi:hypothetical protein